MEETIDNLNQTVLSCILGEIEYPEMVAKIHALIPPRLKPLDLSKADESYPECPLTQDYYDVETWEGGKLHAIHFLANTIDSTDLGEFPTKDLAWAAIEDHRNNLLKQHLL